MACGAPVIASDTTSIPEVVGRTDALFDPARPEAITEKMQQALTDEGFRQSLRSHGLEQARKFSWDESAKKAIAAFESLHEQELEKTRAAVALPKERPRLAFVSPLPPEQSGISTYSAELLPQLARFYDVTRSQRASLPGTLHGSKHMPTISTASCTNWAIRLSTSTCLPF
jgi:hypothetical protein